MTEISLIVTLNNKFNSTQLNSSLGKGKDDEKERESASTPTVEKGGKQKGNGQFFVTSYN